MNRKKPLSSSLEDYLETILDIVSESRAVRPKNIAEKLDVSLPSVTGALRTLAQRSLITYEPYGTITLTDEGQEIARAVLGRHVFLRDFLVNILAVDKDEANEVACKMEHVLSDTVFERLRLLIAYVEKHRAECKDWRLLFREEPTEKKAPVKRMRKTAK